jgi:hypothetical protein
MYILYSANAQGMLLLITHIIREGNIMLNVPCVCDVLSIYKLHKNVFTLFIFD